MYINKVELCRKSAVHIQWGPKVLIRTFALLEMAKYIAIQDHHNSLSQHGISSYVTKFESKSFRLRSNFGVALCSASASASASKSKSRGKGKPNSGNFF